MEILVTKIYWFNNRQVKVEGIKESEARVRDIVTNERFPVLIADLYSKK